MGSLKKIGRGIVCRILESQVKRLRKHHDIQVVAVAGGVGKTSTKMAIAQVLGASHRVRWQEGNYNDRVTVPLIFFDQNEPNILNAFAWVGIFARNELAIHRSYPYDVVLAELGTDGPGFIREFAYLKPDLAVITAVVPEHMEFFGTLDAVAQEELTVLNFAKKALINTDDTPAKYLKGHQYVSYGSDQQATYRVQKHQARGLRGQTVTFTLADEKPFSLDILLLGRHGAKIALAGAATAHLLGASLNDIKQGVQSVSAFAGRMQLLHGVKDSTIIDDTYNASPPAVKAALDVLYDGEAPQRIAILGGMNELGTHSAEAHREIGQYCDPHKLDLVVTIGQEAGKYLAPAAQKQGCIVKAFDSPYDAGAFVREYVREGAVVLAKGSQNRVFAEEALKSLLANTEDRQKLVRQSAYWMKIKAEQFGRK